MSRLRLPLYAACAVSAVVAHACHAQDDAGPQGNKGTIVARATEVTISPELVAYVATNAEGTRFEAGSRPDLEARTPEAIARQLCGSVQPGYLERLGLPPSKAVGGDLYRVKWPACLFIAPPSANRTYSVRRGEVFSSIWERFTGSGRATPKLWSARLATANAPVTDVKAVPEKATLTPPLTTPTVLETNLSALEFRKGLEAVQGGKKVTMNDNVAPGELVMPIESGIGNLAGDDDNCVASKALDVNAIRAAYKIAWDSADVLSNVRAIVVDNGFFGVACTPEGCPASEHYFSETFPIQFFDRYSYGDNFGVGPNVLPRIFPVNYLNVKSDRTRFAAADVDTTSGHGTHVAGLVLGGEAFLPYRSALFREGDKPWLKLTIFNVANGKRALIAGADDAIWNYIDAAGGDTFRVVNMSLVFNRDSTPTLADNVINAITLRNDVLFVVAAGNRLGNISVSAPLPASLGGLGGERNVITVASIGGNDRLSTFSGWGSKVDIAAPGCKLESRLNAEKPPVAASGTSQAAPIVSFAVSLLRHVWMASPLDLKKRLIYAGDQLACDPDADDGSPCIGTGMKLNIWKALLIDHDLVTIGGVTYAGTFESSADFSCKGTPVPWARVRSVRKVPGGANRYAIFYSEGPRQPLLACRAMLVAPAGAKPFSFRQQSIWNGAGLIDKADETSPLPDDIDELILRARKSNQSN